MLELLVAFCTLSDVRPRLALPAADAPLVIKAVAAVRAAPFILKFKKSLRELMVGFAFLSVAGLHSKHARFQIDITGDNGKLCRKWCCLAVSLLSMFIMCSYFVRRYLSPLESSTLSLFLHA